MITKKIKELEAARARTAALERTIASELSRELAALPAAYGFDNAKDFIRAVKAAAGSRRGGRRSAAGSVKRRRRAVITDATRSQVKSMVEAGKTGSAIAKALRISLPSVQNIKKALGLVKARK